MHILIILICIALDEWTDPRHKSVWGFMILTSHRKEFLYQLEDLSDQHHTGEFLASKIEAIITKIGVEKISAIVSDNGANVAAARAIIHKIIQLFLIFVVLLIVSIYYHMIF